MDRETATAGLTADDIADVWGIPKGTVYRYAHIHRWRRYTHAGRAYYHPDDVVATLDQLADDPQPETENIRAGRRSVSPQPDRPERPRQPAAGVPGGARRPVTGLVSGPDSTVGRH